MKKEYSLILISNSPMAGESRARIFVLIFSVDILKAEIPIVEHLCNLDLLPDTDFTFTALPPKFKGIGTFSVRAMAKIK